MNTNDVIKKGIVMNKLCRDDDDGGDSEWILTKMRTMGEDIDHQYPIVPLDPLSSCDVDSFDH